MSGHVVGLNLFDDDEGDDNVQGAPPRMIFCPVLTDRHWARDDVLGTNCCTMQLWTAARLGWFTSSFACDACVLMRRMQPCCRAKVLMLRNGATGSRKMLNEDAT